MWSISDLKAKAWYVLKNCCYWKAVLVAFILGAVGGVGGSSGGSSIGNNSSGVGNSSLSPEVFWTIVIVVIVISLIVIAIGLVFTVFVTNPITVGCRRFFTMSCLQDTEVNEIGIAFRNGMYKTVVKSMFHMTIEIYLWSLLFVIPGIIKYYEYKMVPYILAENPSVSWDEAKSLSIEMMEGNKFNAFLLDLSFIGWGILGIFTCGILLIFWVNPYKCLTDAELYLTLRASRFVQQP